MKVLASIGGDSYSKGINKKSIKNFLKLLYLLAFHNLMLSDNSRK
jgi:hypothetical protein